MPTETGSAYFYKQLTPFTAFAEFTDFNAYTPLPDDWLVLVTDVQASTQAIKSGRYKDVNLIGAASISAVLNCCGDIEVPYSFGGDGASIIVPPTLQTAASEALLRLQSLAQQQFDLRLRVGLIPLRILREQDSDIRVRKLQLSPGNFLAMFAGGGMMLADRLIKASTNDNPYLLQSESLTTPPELSGLSCRWEPLIPRNGRMLVLMIGDSNGDEQSKHSILTAVLQTLTDILGKDPQSAAPANSFSLRFRWPPRGLKLEAKATAGNNNMIWRYIEVLASSLIQLWCERFDKKAGAYNGAVYREELKSNTDFCKYDGILRMVLDVSDDQADQIQAYLDKEYQAGRLVYGVHLADQALMTCLVFHLEQSEHIHFIDGADGGFAFAAADFKSRAEN